MVVRNKVNRGSNRYVVVGSRRAYVQAIVAIASALTTAGIAIGEGVAINENEKHEEARRLAEIQRRDTLKFQAEQNKLTERQLKQSELY